MGQNLNPTSFMAIKILQLGLSKQDVSLHNLKFLFGRLLVDSSKQYDDRRSTHIHTPFDFLNQIQIG